MTIWSRLAGILASGASVLGTAAVHLSEIAKSIGDLDARREIGFTIAVIALSAKMAKADGVVVEPELEAFRQVFTIPEGEERHVQSVFNLARRDIAGFEAYAREVASFFGTDSANLEDMLDSLFHIAKADGVVHERELAYLERIAAIFGFDEAHFARIRSRHVVDPASNPWLLLGADQSWDRGRLRRHYLKLVGENHPDRLTARGLPEECLALATSRMAAINAAWEAIERIGLA